jgi:hypothetical protein
MSIKNRLSCTTPQNWFTPQRASSNICLDGGQNYISGQGNLLNKVHDSRQLEFGWWA